MNLLKIATREIRNTPRLSLYFIINLALGLTGLLTIMTLKDSTETALNSKAKAILSADLEVGARRPLADQEIELLIRHLPQGSQVQQARELFSMLAFSGRSRLVEIKAIDKGYPFYGELRAKNQDGALDISHLFEGLNVWMYPELLIQLGLKIGDKVKIGKAVFNIAGEIIADSAGMGNGFSFAPTVYISLDALKATELLQLGSTGYHSILILLPETSNADSFASQLNDLLPDPAIKITTSQNASDQVSRLLNYLNDYLGLAALVALFLMSVGQVFIYRSLIFKKYYDIALYKTFGLSHSKIALLFIIQLLYLSIMACLPSLLLAHLTLPFLNETVFALTQFKISLALTYKTVLLSLILSTFVTLLLCIPILLPALQIKIKALFATNESARAEVRLSSSLGYFLPAIATYYLLSVYLANSFRVGTTFFLAVIISFILLAYFKSIYIRVIENTLAHRPYFKFALKNLKRAQYSTSAIFIAIGMSVLLTNLIPQIRNTIQLELQDNDSDQRPSLFLFDIQDEQLDSLKNILQNEKVIISKSLPMIRARLLSINNESFTKGLRAGESLTREEENENRFRNRGFNITYRDGLSYSERIIKGEPLVKYTDGDEIQISLEKRFADRLKIKLQDQLTFEIQGAEITGVVKNLRQVRWASFQPNFFIQFQTGVLESAPKTHLVTLPRLSQDLMTKIQSTIVENLPNISIIDVRRVIERVEQIIRQMTFALGIMASFTMVMGLSILFLVTHHQALTRKSEMHLLKTLGISFTQIRALFLIEFLIIVFGATLFGTALSFIMSAFISYFIFEGTVVLNFLWPIMILALLMLFSSIIIIYATHTIFIFSQSNKPFSHS